MTCRSVKGHWYRLDYLYGPGHQSKYIKWVWVVHPLSKESQEDFLENYAMSWWSQWTGTIEEVLALPAEVLKMKRDATIAQRDGAIEFLRVLKLWEEQP